MTRRRVSTAYPLLVLPQAPRLSLSTFADRVGLHPDLVTRLVALGLVPATVDAAGQLWFRPTDLAVIARIRRLRSDLSLNYAAIGLVLDLLERIHQLENAPSRPRRPPPWT